MCVLKDCEAMPGEAGAGEESGDEAWLRRKRMVRASSDSKASVSRTPTRASRSFAPLPLTAAVDGRPFFPDPRFALEREVF